MGGILAKWPGGVKRKTQRAVATRRGQHYILCLPRVCPADRKSSSHSWTSPGPPSGFPFGGVRRPRRLAIRPRNSSLETIRAPNSRDLFPRARSEVTTVAARGFVAASRRRISSSAERPAGAYTTVRPPNRVSLDPPGRSPSNTTATGSRRPASAADTRRRRDSRDRSSSSSESAGLRPITLCPSISSKFEPRSSRQPALLSRFITAWNPGRLRSTVWSEQQ
jgi:hypothetical protein